MKTHFIHGAIAVKLNVCVQAVQSWSPTFGFRAPEKIDSFTRKTWSKHWRYTAGPLEHGGGISHLSMKSATTSKSLSVKPRDVSAGAPRRKPLGRNADLSPGQVFLLHATPISSRTLSARLPSVPCETQSDVRG